jgi:glycosyltransferase involved in cell wall biosynthesis
MKFLMTMFRIQDYGGIINHAEHLALGLRKLGHEVDFMILVPRTRIIEKIAPPKDISHYRLKGTGYRFHQARGWFGVPRIAYLDSDTRLKFREKCASYEAVLWHIPVPTLSAENESINEWLELYDNGTKNIAIIHDGNLPRLYPHLAIVQEKFWAAACVHESAFNSTKCIGIPRKLIVNPFEISGLNKFRNDFKNRSGFVAVQVFKGWKRMDTLIRAIPFMKNDQAKIIGGAGIDYRYMVSKTKCKPKFFEPDGSRIWDNAVAAGMKYKGTLPNEAVFDFLAKARIQIDPSWSRKYSSYGAHFNRTTVEAIIAGAIPLATDLGMFGSKIFKKDKNYIEVPFQAHPAEFAAIVDKALTDENQWARIKENNLKLVQQFDLTRVAQQYVDLVKDKSNLPTGKVDSKTLDKCNKNLDFFGIEPLAPKPHTEPLLL